MLSIVRDLCITVIMITAEMNVWKIICNGIVKQNPTFVLILGMCPTLGTTSSAINGMSMGLATMFVLMCSNMSIAALRTLVPEKVRIPAYIIIIASFVTVMQMMIQAYLPALNESLGIFIPLIVVNCILLGRAEVFASKNSIFHSLCDGIGIGLGFAMALTLLGSLRELLGAGTVFGVGIYDGSYASLVFVLAPGAFIVLGFLIAIFNFVQYRRSR